MLRRNSSRNKQRRPLSRSKSANSVARSPVRLLEVIDPDTAERDARIAAVLSYHRSQSRNSHDIMATLPRDPASFYPDRNDGFSSSDRRSLGRSESTKSRPTGSEAASGIRRRQSVRFVGPNAPPRRNLASRASESSQPSGVTSSSLRFPGRMDDRPASTSSYSSRTPDPHGLTKRYLDSLQATNESYIPDDEIASMPSSYRRLRKSKSMFSTSSPPPNQGYCFGSGATETNYRQKISHNLSLKRNENDPFLADYPPRPSTSIGVLKGQRTAASRQTSRAENDLAVQLARDKFRQQAQEQSRLKPRASTLFSLRNRRSESSMGFRKSLRNSSNNSTALSSTFSTHSLSVPKQPGLRNTARKVSRSLKSKLKGIFTRPKSTTDPEDFDDMADRGNDSDGGLGHDNEVTSQEASISRVQSHVPALHAVPSSQELKSRKGSVGSINSTEEQLDEEKSRVTSWTNSSVEIASTTGDIEHQKLPIITEMSGSLLPSSNTFKLLPPSDHGEGPLSRLTVDSQRVYSALMKKMDKIKEQEAALRKNINSMSLRGTASSRGSTDRGWGSSTIRYVRPEDDVFGDDAENTLTRERRSSESSVKTVDQVAVARPDSSCEIHHTILDEISSPRAGHDAQLDVSATLTNRSSAFFASPACHMFRTTSPYRRALRENILASEEQDKANAQEPKYPVSLSEISLPPRRSGSPGSEKDTRIAYTESVYSSATEDAKMPTQTGARSLEPELPGLLPSEGHGNVTIFADAESRNQHYRETSTASSVEWKTWLSAKVSKLEGSAKLSDGSFEETSNFLSSLGHVREGAQIDSPDECLKLPPMESEASPTRNPLGSIEMNARTNSSNTMLQVTNKPALSRDENAAPGAQAYLWLEEYPTIPPRSRLRTVPSPSKAVDCESRSQGEGTSSLQARPYNTLGRLESTPEQATHKRRSRPRVTGWAGSPAKSSPGLTAAVERQFLGSGTTSPIKKTSLSSSHSTPRSRREDHRDEAQESGQLRSRDSNRSLLGSKHMVDMFLDSRRKRVQREDHESGMGSSPAMFL